MRNSEEISKSYQEHKDNPKALLEGYILEVLLDIRDLLTPPKPGHEFAGQLQDLRDQRHPHEDHT